MKQNMGLLDRFIRLAVAAFWGIIYFISGVTGRWAIVLIVLIGYLVVTAIAATCLFYRPFKIDTRSEQDKPCANKG